MIHDLFNYLPWKGGMEFAEKNSIHRADRKTRETRQKRNRNPDSIGKMLTSEALNIWTRERFPFYFAYSTARVSRITVTLIWPG